jgi:hypothetical protein
VWQFWHFATSSTRYLPRSVWSVAALTKGKEANRVTAAVSNVFIRFNVSNEKAPPQLSGFFEFVCYNVYKPPEPAAIALTNGKQCPTHYGF